MSVTVHEAGSGVVLARGEMGNEVVGYEGNLYFDPGAVNQTALKITERTYTCPYKGTCNWVDYHGADGTVVRDVAWVYPNVKAGHEVIQGRYGFYAGRRGGTRVEGA